ncbi:Uncharacterised protein [Vibrio cholerae]|nr:Uncharacterised protein [Vibrio cholerae]CSI81370.1 Uncharacterised protein [Vibrio cholerae]
MLLWVPFHPNIKRFSLSKPKLFYSNSVSALRREWMNY